MVSFRDYLSNVGSPQSKQFLEKIWIKCLLHAKKREYIQGFDCYKFLLENCPQVGPFLEDELLSLLNKWSRYIITDKREDQMQEVMIAYTTAVRHCQNPAKFFNSCGKLFFRLERHSESLTFFEEARKLDPDDLEAHENLDNLNSTLVDRWHFPMLNDRLRNSRYREALRRHFAEMRADSDGGGKEVAPVVCLDIGAGTGLLSMYAASAADEFLPPSSVLVVSCELDRVMCQMAEGCLDLNGFRERIRLVRSSSNDLTKLPGCPDNVRLSTVVTETFDAGLLGEGVLESLDHVHRVLRREGEDLKVIPQAATVHFCLVESEHIRNYSRFLGGTHLPEPPGGLEIFGDVGSPGHPYSCEKLDLLRGPCRPLSDPVAVETFDFRSGEAVAAYLEGVTKRLSVTASQGGSLDALVLWFDLHLGSDLEISTSPLTPEGRSSCWQQAVYPVLEVEGRTGIRVEEGDVVSVECRIKDLIHLECLSVRGRPGTTGRPEPPNVPAAPRRLLHPRLPPTCIALLNDRPYHGECIRALERIFLPLAGRPKPPGLIVVSRRDGLSGLVPALWALRSRIAVRFLIVDGDAGADHDDVGVSEGQRVDVEKVLGQLVAMGTDDDSAALSFRAIPSSSASDDEEDDDDEDGDDDDEEEEEEEEEDDDGEMSVDQEDDPIDWIAAFFDPIGPSGSVRPSAAGDLRRIRRLGLLPRTTAVLPSRIRCEAVLVRSESLLRDSSFVSDSSTEPFVVGSFINRFRTSYHVNLHLGALPPHVRVTEPIHLFALDPNTPEGDGWPGSCSVDLAVEAAAAGPATHLVYWFRLEMGGDDAPVVVDTSEGHWKQSAVNLEPSLAIGEGDLVRLKVDFRAGYFKVKVEKA